MRTNQRFAFLIGAALLAAGVWGLSHPVIFRALTTNRTQAITHIALGAIGIFAAVKKCATGYAALLGVGLLAVGIMWFMPSMNAWVVGTFNLNQAAAVANILVGVISLLVSFATRSDVVKTPKRKR